MSIYDNTGVLLHYVYTAVYMRCLAIIYSSSTSSAIYSWNEI